jgi:hypothetical protein
MIIRTPTPNKEYLNNYDKIFRKDEAPELEKCLYCGCTVEDPCDSPPPDMCEKAINVTYGDPCKT